MDMYCSRRAASIITDAFENMNCYHLLTAAGKQNIYFRNRGEQFIYCLRSGDAEVRRVSDDTIVSYIRAPVVSGLTLLPGGQIYHYLKTTIPAELIVVRHDRGMEVIAELNLWREAYLVTSDVANMFFIRDEACASRNVYGLVRQHLEMLWEMDETQRAGTSVFEFILSRTTISRSSLNKILKDLSAGEYIKMHRGKLLEKENLPRNY